MTTESLIAEEISRKRIEGLRKLLGYVENGTSDTLTISQDDATYSYIVRVGKRSVYGSSFLQTLDEAIATLIDKEDE